VNPRHADPLTPPGNPAPALFRQPPALCGHLRHCTTLCSKASVNSVTLCHPPPYGRRAAPSKEDGETLEKGTGTCPTPTRDDAVTSDQRSASPHHLRPCSAIPAAVQPSRALCSHPQRHGNPGRQDVATPVAVHLTTFRQPHPRVSVRMATKQEISTKPPSKPLLGGNMTRHDA
jgi:hypothetical protein